MREDARKQGRHPLTALRDALLGHPFLPAIPQDLDSCAHSLDGSSAATIVRPQCERTRGSSIRYRCRPSKPRPGCRLSTK
jgi:hypothetical protein